MSSKSKIIYFYWWLNNIRNFSNLKYGHLLVLKYAKSIAIIDHKMLYYNILLRIHIIKVLNS